MINIHRRMIFQGKDLLVMNGGDCYAAPRHHCDRFMVNDLMKETVPADFQCPDEAKRELAILTGTNEGTHLMEGNNSLVPVGCPACGGPLWEMEGKFARYRCHIGHAFTGRNVVQGLKKGEEQALYAALRAMEERSRMLKKLTKESLGHLYAERLRESESHAQQLRGMLRIRKSDQWKC